MKKVNILLFLTSLILVACVSTQPRKTGEYLVYENYNFQFKDLGNWIKTDPGGARKFGNIYVYRNKNKPATVWIRALKFEEEPKYALDESADRWINAMAQKYNWKDLKYMSDGWTNIDGEKSYWKEYEFFNKNKEVVEKIYRVYLNKIGYQFRLTCGKEAFDELVPEFDDWITKIKFLK